MNRKWLSIVVAVIIILSVGSALAAPTVIMDGQQLIFEVPPTIENGTTLVPMRDIFNALGTEIEWDGTTQTVTANKKTLQQDISIKLTIGQTTAYKNHSPVKLDVPAKIINQRTMVPLRFVSEALDVMVGWDANTQVISLGYVPPTGTIPIPPQAETKVHFIDVGQADSIYIQLPDHVDILIDGGNAGDGQTVVNYLQDQNADDIELLIATHPHEDHIGGLPAVFDAYKVEKVVDSGYFNDTATCREYINKMMVEGAESEEDNRQTFTWGNAALQILTANEAWDDCNDYSVVCRLDTGDIEFLFEGDAETSVEGILSGDISAEILKVGHHGSSSSSSASFLSRVSPKVAVISVGTGNSYGHPTAETLSKLQAAGATIYRTDLNGNIVVTTDGSTYSVSTSKIAAYSVPAAVTSSQTQTQTQTVQPTAQDTQEETVYVTKTGSKYHRAGCKYLKDSSIPMSLKDAQVAGYTPCSACNP